MDLWILEKNAKLYDTFHLFAERLLIVSGDENLVKNQFL